MDKKLHVLVVPFPAQGHLMPLMRLSHKLVDYGVKVTFVNTNYRQTQLEAAMANEGLEDHNHQLHLVSVPDGMEREDWTNDLSKVTEVMPKVMIGHIEDLIRKFNESDDGEAKITCVISDANMAWVLEVAKKMGIKQAAFWPTTVRCLTDILQIPKLIDDGIIDENGIPIKGSSIPGSSIDDSVWNGTNNPTTQKVLFKLCKTVIQGVKFADWILCNSIYEIEPASCDMIPGILTIGPLLPTNKQSNQYSWNFWQEDSTCLSWLDEQPIGSVVYVAFGSSTIFNQQQFDELYLGLKLLDRPFLWAVRPDLINGVVTAHADGSEGGVPHRGKIVSWAPQQKVLAHPSIACFLSHCGWNSTIEGLSSGVPFLCWPYFTDQFGNQAYICDVWKVGLKLNSDVNGTISKFEIKRKVERLLCDEGIKAKALKLKDMARMSINEGGSSLKNLDFFLEQIKK